VQSDSPARHVVGFVGKALAAAAVVAWAWFWAAISGLGFSDLAYDRGRSGLPVLAVGVLGAALGSRLLSVRTRWRWLVFGLAMTLPVLLLVDWLRDLADYSP
jgi:hypothetical protein